MTGTPSIVTEVALPEFRERYLTAGAIYEVIPDDGVVLVVDAPPGTGKTTAAHSIIPYALLNGHDLVVFVAPTRALIAELLESGKLDDLGRRTMVLEPRPRARCGDLDPEWAELETSGCAALGKLDLCGSCPYRTGDAEQCGWPDQLDRIDPNTQVVVMTEQYLILKPTLLQDLLRRTKSKRPMVIFDEAGFLGDIQARRFSNGDLKMFRAALAAAANTGCADREGLMAWISGIDELLAEGGELSRYPRFSLFDLGSSVVPIQAAGRRLFGNRFRYLGYDLSLLNSRVIIARWHQDGMVEIVVRIDTSGCDVLVFASYLASEIIEERLQREVHRAIPNLLFRHSETRIANITDTVGTIRALSSAEHFNRVVDFFIALLLRDRLMDRRSVVVAKKALVPRIKTRIEVLTEALGCPLVCVVGGSGTQIDISNSGDVVLLNYGVVGINDLKHHDALYCIGGYYAREDHVSSVYQQALPPYRRHHLRITTRARQRQVVSGDGRFDSRFHARRASATHRLLERTVVLQAVGRVRPFTSPADVIVFQMDDLSAELGEIETHGSLAKARTAWNVPTLSEMKRSALGDRMRVHRAGGEPYRKIALTFGVSVSTAHKALKAQALDDLLLEINR